MEAIEKECNETIVLQNVKVETKEEEEDNEEPNCVVEENVERGDAKKFNSKRSVMRIELKIIYRNVMKLLVIKDKS